MARFYRRSAFLRRGARISAEKFAERAHRRAVVRSEARGIHAFDLRPTFLAIDRKNHR